MNCVFEKDEDKYKCMECGFITHIPDLKINCNPSNAGKMAPPSLVQRARNFAKAAAKHVQSGRRHCTQEQKEARFKQCASDECGLFMRYGKGGICSHEDCGCFIRSKGKFFDKLSWAESKCPEGYWGPIEEKDNENTEKGV